MKYPCFFIIGADFCNPVDNFNTFKIRLCLKKYRKISQPIHVLFIDVCRHLYFTGYYILLSNLKIKPTLSIT